MDFILLVLVRGTLVVVFTHGMIHRDNMHALAKMDFANSFFASFSWIIKVLKMIQKKFRRIFKFCERY